MCSDNNLSVPVITIFKTLNTLRLILAIIKLFLWSKIYGETSRSLEMRKSGHNLYIMKRQVGGSTLSENIFTADRDHTVE